MRHETFDTRPNLDTHVIPHILKTDEDGFVCMVTDGSMSKGDTYTVLPNGIKRPILEVIESRPARGDWSGKSYQGMKPTFNRIKSK